MKKNSYYSAFHIYIIFLTGLLLTVLTSGGILLSLVTLSTPSGVPAKSNWPKEFSQTLKNQILFVDGYPELTQAGAKLLQENQVGMQLLNHDGYEIFCYNSGADLKNHYSNNELLQLSQEGAFPEDGNTIFISGFSYNDIEYTALFSFPLKISKVTMYLNESRFSGGKIILLWLLGILFVLILFSGIAYSLYTAKAISRITASIKNIFNRSYLPVRNSGMFGDIYDSLNHLNAEINSSDQLRKQTEQMHKEWIANITHDLKTPLSPIKGYAELLSERRLVDKEQQQKYAAVILKNTAYIEALINDLKITYQLKNNMLPLERKEGNLVRFLKEFVIDVLNNPEYERRIIHFESNVESILMKLDEKLLTRVFYNLIINAFVHGHENTEVTIQVSASEHQAKIRIADNGPGMTELEASKLFLRYYRGEDTVQKPEGTGLGLAIAKSIIELHKGNISVSSKLGMGTVFQITFPQIKVN